MSLPDRKCNQSGIDLIMKFEGCLLKSYLCPAKVYTIGYGHTGKDVKEGMSITQAEADRLLLADISIFCNAVNAMVTKEINENQFSALVSFSFNLGYGALRSSTLLRYVNAGNFQEAAKEFDRWNRAGGKILDGLSRRREAERRLFEA